MCMPSIKTPEMPPPPAAAPPKPLETLTKLEPNAAKKKRNLARGSGDLLSSLKIPIGLPK